MITTPSYPDGDSRSFNAASINIIATMTFRLRGQTLEQGDLILYIPAVEGIKKKMLLVMSLSNGDGKKPTLDTILVKPVKCSFVQQPGYWTLDGPDVLPVLPRSHQIDETNIPLREILAFPFFLGPRGNRSCDCDYDHNKDMIIINPHGRDVLESYFCYDCPVCGNAGFTCRGCRTFRDLWPDLFGGSCGLYQTCPMCMGEELASQDWQRYEEIEALIHDVRRNGEGRKEGTSLMSDEEWQALITRVKSLHQERFRMLNERRAEMGMPPEGDDGALAYLNTLLEL